MTTLLEPARQLPVLHEVDVCVLGGSCTGVFAAVTAARLGCAVALVEQQNGFGGVATSGLVNIWHSLQDTAGTRQIIGGLTLEMLRRLERRDAVEWWPPNPHVGTIFNTEELKIELDALVLEHRVIPLLHTRYAAPYLRDGALEAILVENKSGRGAIRARIFIDATGDGDLCAHLGIPASVPEHPQPPTSCLKVHGLAPEAKAEVIRALAAHRAEYDLPEGFIWGAHVPGAPALLMFAGTRVFGVNCAEAADLTRAEMEGRRQARALLEIIRRYVQPEPPVTLAALASCIGIRETRHIACRYRLTEEDVLTGRPFPDAIANGSYRVDVHHNEKPGVTFRYLDGTEEYARPGSPSVTGRWRPETAEHPTFYQIPYRCLLPQTALPNLLVCGRAIDADRGAFGAIRVMVNTNQTGEAAGAAAALALHAHTPVQTVDPARLRQTLAELGSVMA